MQFSSIKEKVRRYTGIILDSLLIQAGALCGFYGLIVSIYLILHVVIGERWFIISALNNGAHLITMFCVPAFLVTLIVKRYRFPWTLYLIPGTLAFLIWHGGEFLPKANIAADPDAIEFTVMTYNIAESYTALSAVANDTFNADIVGLQEVPRRMTGLNSFSERGGNAIYTPYPVASEIPEAIYRVGNSNAISAVKIEIKIEGHLVSVYSLHNFRPTLTLRPFSYVTSPRSDDTKALVEAVANDPNPVIVFCDCNFSDQTDDYKLMASQLKDAWKEMGLGLGLTANAPAGGPGFPFLLLRSDYIWHSDEFETLSIEVLPTELSDHYPVRARLRLRS